jgi:NTP pyrophosphatase (non-canonical NTP hydrolase)
VEFEGLIRQAMAVRRRYEQFEQAAYGRAWTAEEVALGFVGDVGDLAKLIQAHHGVRDIPDARAKLAHELADCLWSVIVLSNMLEVDLEDAFVKTLNELEAYLERQSQA